MANAPGWYPDPWRPGQRRWWDGAGWTDHTHDPNAAPASPVYWAQPDPRRDLQAERSAAVWAKRGFIAFFASRIIGGIASLVALNNIVDDIRHSIDTDTPLTTRSPAWQLLNMPVSILSILGLVAIVIWTNKAVTLATNLGYPMRHQPGWYAAGWIVPILNLWFPYQALRDSLAPTNPARSTVNHWYVAYLANLFLWLPAIAASAFGAFGLALALALPAVLASAFQLHCELQLVDAIAADHAEAISRIVA
jgi:hypothetical protein